MESSQQNILLVDDKPENLLVLEKLLSCFPVMIFKANSGAHAIEMTLQHNFCLILLDVQMPGMDGYQVLEQLAWDEKTKYIPVIFITANYKDEIHQLKGYQYGAVDYLYKPINEEILLGKVKVFIELASQKEKISYLKTRYESILNSAAEGILELSMDGKILYANPAAENLLQASTLRLLERPFLSLLSSNNGKNQAQQEQMQHAWNKHPLFKTCLKGDSYHQADSAFTLPHNTLLPVEYTATPLCTDENTTVAIVIVFSDISLRKTVEEKLTNLALSDHLTKLPNRLFFEKTMLQVISRAQRQSTHMALLFLDLNKFKQINDNLGHDIGDLLLQGVAARLNTCVRLSDTIARLGGDEFAIILDNIKTMEGAGIVAEKIIAALSTAFILNGHEILASTAIGIAVFPESGTDMQTLIKNADIAMYEAKQSKSSNYKFFTPSMNKAIAEKLELIESLRDGINNEEFVLYYQPIFDLNSKKLFGVEALLRWKHPRLGLLVPDKFIHIAEESGLIHKLGVWVLEKAAMTYRHFQERGYQSMVISVNVSVLQLLQGDLLDDIKHALKKTAMPPRALNIELTESSLVTNQEFCARILHDLHDLGVSVAIDDFGTGYSSLNYLKNLPVDTLKIDKSFVQDIFNSHNDASIVKAIIALAHNLNLSVIAEGVETKAQEKFLADNKCDQTQGYLYGKPLDLLDLEVLLDAN